MNQKIKKIKKKTLLDLAFLVVNLKKYCKIEDKKFEKLNWKMKLSLIKFFKSI